MTPDLIGAYGLIGLLALIAIICFALVFWPRKTDRHGDDR